MVSEQITAAYIHQEHSLIFLRTLFAAWLASDLMPTPYELKL